MKYVKFKSIVVSLILISMMSAISTISALDSNKAKGRIMGVVVDRYDARVANAQVIIEQGKFKREIKSGEAGEFKIELPAGVYQIEVYAPRFLRFYGESLKVKSNVTEMINIHLIVGAGDHSIQIPNS
jgi:hypothetical protein